MVNADDRALRANRLTLLSTLHASMNRVANLALLGTLHAAMNRVADLARLAA